MTMILLIDLTLYWVTFAALVTQGQGTVLITLHVNATRIAH